jgi:hypothetical protein
MEKIFLKRQRLLGWRDNSIRVGGGGVSVSRGFDRLGSHRKEDSGQGGGGRGGVLARPGGEQRLAPAAGRAGTATEVDSASQSGGRRGLSW